MDRERIRGCALGAISIDKGAKSSENSIPRKQTEPSDMIEHI